MSATKDFYIKFNQEYNYNSNIIEKVKSKLKNIKTIKNGRK